MTSHVAYSNTSFSVKSTQNAVVSSPVKISLSASWLPGLEYWIPIKSSELFLIAEVDVKKQEPF